MLQTTNMSTVSTSPPSCHAGAALFAAAIELVSFRASLSHLQLLSFTLRSGTTSYLACQYTEPVMLAIFECWLHRSDDAEGVRKQGQDCSLCDIQARRTCSTSRTPEGAPILPLFRYTQQHSSQQEAKLHIASIQS